MTHDSTETVVFGFANRVSFPIIESASRIPGQVSLQVCKDDKRRYLEIRLQPGDASPEGDERNAPVIALHLPPIAIHGQPRSLILDVNFDAPGYAVALDAFDASGEIVSFAFDAPRSSGWQRVGAAFDVRWVECLVQPTRLRISFPSGGGGAALGIATLSVTGDVRLASPGLADSGC